METLNKISGFLNQILMWIGGCFLVAMILLTCSNIFFRIVWVPVKGTFELMGYIGAIVTAFALGYTQIKRGHISVDVLINSFSKKTRAILDTFNCTVCMVFFAMAAWQIARYATNLWQTGEVTETLRIVYFPFTYGVAFGCAILSLVSLTDVLKNLFQDKEGEK